MMRFYFANIRNNQRRPSHCFLRAIDLILIKKGSRHRESFIKFVENEESQNM